MFGNLVESSSHTSEFARRGKFILGTMLSYGILVVAGVVGSVYAYDAHLESQNLEMVTLLSPVMPPDQKQVQPPDRSRAQTSSQQNQTPIRTVAISRLADSTKLPDTVSTDRVTVPEAPRGHFDIGKVNIDPAGPVGPVGDPNTGSGQPPIEIGDPPPVKPVAPPEQKKQPIIVSKGPVTGQAISLPKPVYPRMAADAKVRGAVKVQVLIDEHGKVVSAQVLDGPILLRAVSEQAAWRARFNPTTLGDVPVKVSGYIVYNFSQ